MDAEGIPLPGAAVIIVGDTRGVAAAIDGNFSIEVKNTDKILVQNLRMHPETIAVSGKSYFDTTLKDQTSILEELMIVGCGYQKKESVVGAISTVKPDELKAPVGNLSTSLAGQLTGVISAQRSGEPVAQSDFWIRGVSTYGAYNLQSVTLFTIFPISA